MRLAKQAARSPARACKLFLTIAVALVLPLALAARAKAQVNEANTVAAGNDAAGFVPAREPPAFAFGGYLDVGFADAGGDGTSFHPDDARLPVDYGVDPFAPAINSRGDVASTEHGDKLTNGFLPRSVGIAGRPSFLINTLALDARHGAPGDTMLVFARVHLLPRLESGGNATRLVVEQAFGRVQPFANEEFFLFVGKFDSVFGIEYLFNQSTLRTGITPSLLARYTTGTSIGAKALYRVQLPALASAVSLNVAVTNSAPFIEVLQSPEVSLTGRPTLSARLGYELNLPAVQLKLGGSVADGARNDQRDPETGVRLLGADARLHAFGLSLAGEVLYLDQERAPAAGKQSGGGPAFLASGFHVRGFWLEGSYAAPVSGPLFRRSAVYARIEQRRGWFEGFAHVIERRFTVGARLDLAESVALKGELLFNRELRGAPTVDNDVRTASLVWAF